MASLTMNPTNQVKFEDLKIDEYFFHQGTFWRKTTYTAAKDLKSGGYGSCSFTIDEEDKIVTAVKLEIKC